MQKFSSQYKEMSLITYVTLLPQENFAWAINEICSSEKDDSRWKILSLGLD